MYFLGYDIGSSSVKACLVEAASGKTVAADFFPKEEMKITAHRAGWAEQNPADWWGNLVQAHHAVMVKSGVRGSDIKAIGISWQMHGLVLVDKEQNVLRPAIIWCDSRAVPYGEAAFRAIGQERCLSHLLNSPANFTAAKLAWVKENEPKIYGKIDKLMLPGDYIAMRLSGDIGITVEGLSEGIFWDFKKKTISADILNYFGFDKNIFPEIKPVFGIQAAVSAQAAQELGLQAGTPVTYRAGDQPNNALSLNVFNAGEIAATAGTSGVVYGVLDKVNYDKKSRVNTFAHVNYDPAHALPKEEGESVISNFRADERCAVPSLSERVRVEYGTRLGVLLCINGTGILNSWIRKNIGGGEMGYAAMNELAAKSPAGSRGISIIPFGNGAERVLENRETGCSFHNINFNTHDRSDILRAAQEGIVFSFQYGMEIMREMGMDIKLIRAGYANMFLSPIFAETLASISGATIELLNTDGAAGAAKAAGMGLGYYKDNNEAFGTLQKLATIEPNKTTFNALKEAYERWKGCLGG
ncbi:carbohydrate kinase [Bacteroidia bacterium]|nr:carbohydrate kinase [Bacteroidia bacterium]